MTIAQQLKTKEFPLMIKDSRGRLVYWEDSTGYWFKHEYDINGKLVCYKNSKGYWEKREYDADGKQIRYEDSKGYWEKREYDARGNTIYLETPNGVIIDNRPKTELTLDEIAAKFGVPVEQLKIKK